MRKELPEAFYKIELPCSCPSESSLRDMLSTVNTVSFYGFLMALTKNSAINASIGEFPIDLPSF